MQEARHRRGGRLDQLLGRRPAQRLAHLLAGDQGQAAAVATCASTSSTYAFKASSFLFGFRDAA